MQNYEIFKRVKYIYVYKSTKTILSSTFLLNSVHFNYINLVTSQKLLFLEYDITQF